MTCTYIPPNEEPVEISHRICVQGEYNLLYLKLVKKLQTQENQKRDIFFPAGFVRKKIIDQISQLL